MSKATRSDLIRWGVEIAGEYNGNLTVRQLYYQLVARGLVDSGQRVYKRVVSAISAARMDGAMPFDWIVDRTRECKASAAFESSVSVESAMDQAAGWVRSMPLWAINRDRWWGQPVYPTVGVEKEALAGVFDDPCGDLGVGLFVFRGYTSLSALYQLAGHLHRAGVAGAEEAVLLYFGDHDPDGWEIPRSAARNLPDIAALAGLRLPALRVERVALNMDQIERYDPPPFEAKVTSSRCRSYVEEHDTDEAWELDALRPDVLQRLIRDSVSEHFDQGLHERNRDLVAERRAEMTERMQEDGWLDSIFED